MARSYAPSGEPVKRRKISPKVRRELYAAADYRCAHCGWRPDEIPDGYDGAKALLEWSVVRFEDGRVEAYYRYLAIDHIYPLHLGGTYDRSNLQVLCSSCTSRKGVKV